MTNRPSPPEHITLAYQVIGGPTHVFTADKFRGLHVSSSSLRTAFEEVLPALSEHVSLVYGCRVEYKIDMDFAEFERLLNEPPDTIESLTHNFVLATRSLNPGALSG